MIADHRAPTVAAVLLLLPTAAARGQASQYSLRFYGTGSGQQDRVILFVDDDGPGVDQSTPADIGGGGFTVEFWIRGDLAQNATPSMGGDQSVFDSSWLQGNVVVDRHASGTSRGFGVSIAGGRIRFGTGFSDATPSDPPHTLEGSDIVLDGTWHHVACVRDAISGRKSIYVDGALDIESEPFVSTDDLSHPDAGTPLSASPVDAALVLGAEKYDQGPSSPAFSGYLDEVRLWNAALSGFEIRAIKDRVLPPNTPGLAASYRFEEGSGTDLADSAGTGAPTATLVAGSPGNGEWASYAADPGNTAPVVAQLAPPSFVVDPVLTGLTEPVALASSDDGRLFVATRSGLVLVLVDGVPLPQPVLQVPSEQGHFERGVHEIALDPGFSNNGYLYVHYSTPEPRNRVSRFTVVNNAADPASEFVVWQNPNLAGEVHHGGGLAFDAAGNLFIATGDQGGAWIAQDLATHDGKILRVATDGSIPADNPFLGVGGADPAVWAFGLRNPYRIHFDAATGSLWVGDVGSNSSLSYEEIDRAGPGDNLGWPDQEGPNCWQGPCASFSYPFYAYARTDWSYGPAQPQACIILGPVYRHALFPAEYQGDLFFADYSNRWIRRLDLDADPPESASFLLPPGIGSPVDLEVASDGSMWIVTLGGYGPAGPEASMLARVSHASGNAPPQVVASADVTAGPTPLAVQFSSSGTVDLDDQPGPLTYRWDFGDGLGSTQPSPQHVYAQPGAYTATLVVDDGQTSVSSMPIPIQAGNAPKVTIDKPAPGQPYRAGDSIQFSGSATDPEDGRLPASALTWTVVMVVGGGTLPVMGPVSGVSSGSFSVPDAGHPADGAYLEVRLEAVDSHGLKTTVAVPLSPETAKVTIDSVPSGLPFALDGQAGSTPHVFESLIGSKHEVSAPKAAMDSSGEDVVFVCWSDGGEAAHEFTTPGDALALTAFFAGPSSGVLQVAVPAADRNAQHDAATGQVFADPLNPTLLCFGDGPAGEIQAGFEFALPIPQGAAILAAELECVAGISSGPDLEVDIRAYDVADAPPFVQGSAVPLTQHAANMAASVPWTVTSAAPQQILVTPDLAGFIQALVSRPDWTPGGHVGIVFDPVSPAPGAQRCVNAFASGQGAILRVTWSGTPSVPCSAACGFSTFGNDATPAHTIGLIGTGSARVGGVATIEASSVPAATAYFMGGTVKTQYSILGGELLIDPIGLLFLVTAPASRGEAGLPLVIPQDPQLAGMTLHFQAAAPDAAKPQGYAFSNGLTMVVCP